MRWLNQLLGNRQTDKSAPTRLKLETLEERDVPDATAAVVGGVLSVNGANDDNRITITTDPNTQEIVVEDKGLVISRVNPNAITQININTGEGRNNVKIADSVRNPVFVNGGSQKDLIVAGGGNAVLTGNGGNDKLGGGLAANTLTGGDGNDLLVGGINGPNVFDGGPGTNRLSRVRTADSVIPNVNNIIAFDPGLVGTPGQPFVQESITAAEVEAILRRASAATSTNDAIIAIVDRNGRPLGVAVENGVAPEIQNNIDLRTFAIDGAIAKARTGAFFGNNQGPLTSRTVRFISQSTITQREVESNPSITNRDSTERGPGFVAPVGLGGHFPPGIAQTPPVDLVGIEHTNRDRFFHPGADRTTGTADDISLTSRNVNTPEGITVRSGRFDVNQNFVLPGQELFPPDSYGVYSGIRPNAQARGIATSPGGIPIYKNGQVVGGIGVFFPGKTGFATEENTSLSTTFDPTKADRTLEAEYIGFAAVGGAPLVGAGFGAIGGVGLDPRFFIPLTEQNKRLDLVGIQLDVIGPQGVDGITSIVNIGTALGTGPAAFTFAPVTPGRDGVAQNGDEPNTIAGLPAPEGWLVLPHDGVGITAEQATQIIINGINQANITRAAIRLPLSSATRMVFAVADQTGEIVALFRMPDATIFSIDVAVAKARNVAYYADPNQLQDVDSLKGAGIQPGVALTNRTFRYLALPRFPSSIDGAPPGPFSKLQDPGVNRTTARLDGAKLPASVYDSVFGFDAFNPGTNFRQTGSIRKQNGIVFFPGSVPLYRNGQLIGGFGVSGDGVDQDDVVTQAGSLGFEVPPTVQRADDVFINGVRLPYDKSLRNPEGF